MRFAALKVGREAGRILRLMDKPLIKVSIRAENERVILEAAEAIFARAAWIGAFLDAVEKGSVGRADVEPGRLNLLKTYPDQAVRERASRIFVAGLPRRQDVVAAYQKALVTKGDRERGKTVFQKQCSSCHRLENVGQQIGAELSAAGRATTT